MTVNPTETRQSVIFDNLNFLVVVNNPNEVEECNNIVELIKKNGSSSCEVYHTYKLEYQIPRSANLRKWFLRQDFNKKEIHIVVSNSSNFQLYPLFEYDLMIPVVTTNWVSLCIESQRHVRTSNFSPNPKLIFKDFQMLVSKNAFSQAEYFLLSEIIHCLGGTTVDYITKATTHIVTTNPSDPAITTIERYKSSRTDSNESMNIQYILPTWPAQCFLENYLVSINDHLVPPSADKNEITERQNDIWDDIHGFESLYNNKKKKVLLGKKFKISTDIELSPKIYRYFISLIKILGGNYIQDNNEDEDELPDVSKGYLIMNTENSDDVLPEDKLARGNLLWIVNIWNRNKFLHPQSNIMFAPLKRKIFKKKDLIVTYTNYFGAQRLYLQRLIEFVGGSATMELSKQNTHLICNIPFGKKYEVAEKWAKNGSSIKICSHRWLEQCYKLGKRIDLDSSEFLNLNRLDNSYTSSLGQLNFGNSELTEESEEETDIEDSQANPFQFIANSQMKNSQRNDDSIIGEKPSQVASLDTADSSKKTAITDTTNAVLDQESTGSINELQKSSDPPTVEKPAVTEMKHSTIENPLQPSIASNKDTERNSENKDTFTNDDIFDTAPTAPAEPMNNISISSAAVGNINDVDDNNKNDSNQNEEQNEEPNRGIALKNTDPNHNENDITDPIQETEQNEDSKENKQLSDSENRVSQSPLGMNAIQDDVSTGIGSRKAKAQAAKRLHQDIESLNEHEKNSSKKRKVRDRNGALLLPEEIKQLERIEKLKSEAKDILSKNKYIFNEETKQIIIQFNINAICTGFAVNDLSDVDKQLLELLGIHLLHDDIDKHLFEDQRIHRGKNRINTIISPKMARTVKFLKSFSLTSLTNFLVPQFLIDLIDDAKNGKNIEKYRTIPHKYMIEGIQEEMIEKIKGPKVFDKSSIHEINVVSDIKGGPRVIIDILKCHGIKEASIVSKTYSLEDIKRNRKSPNYVLLASTKAQANKFKKMLADTNATVLVVNWDWCVNSIFNSTTNYDDKQNIFYSRLTN